MQVKEKLKYSYEKMELEEKRYSLEEAHWGKVVVVLSGGMDSTTLLYKTLDLGCEVYPISFYYGQRHSKELKMAELTCSKLNLSLKRVDISVLGELAPSALTREDIDIPEGNYDDPSMKQTVVPNRNMVFLALATSYAIGLEAEAVYLGAHSGDHAIYPDCRPKFIRAMDGAIGLCDYSRVYLDVPFMSYTKTGILRIGMDLGVDYSLTWSCYKGNGLACGKCGTCVERLEAFRELGLKDPLEYENG